MKWKTFIGALLVLVCASVLEGLEMDDFEEEEVFGDAAVRTTPFHTTQYRPPTTTKDYCHCDIEIYGPDDLDGVLKSPNFPLAHCNLGRCTYKILPHPNMTVRLEVETASLSKGSQLKFWNIFDVDGKEYSIFHSINTERPSYHADKFDDYKELTTGKNVGWKLVFEPRHNDHGYSGFKITFERKLEDSKNHVCDEPRQYIGAAETTVTRSKDFAIGSGCVFLLSPVTGAIEQGLQEMFIDIKTEEGTFVAVRSYDDAGLFVRDAFSDASRVKLVDASKVELLVRQNRYAETVFKFPEITAKLIDKGCACPETPITLSDENNKAIIRSPGFPDLYCPGKTCHTSVVSRKADKRDPRVPLLMISTNCSIAYEDSLKLSSYETQRIIFETGHRELVPTKFLRPIIINQQDLKVTFSASGKVQHRFFEMNVTRVLVPKECVCSLFNDKEFDNHGYISALIPKSCNILHCHWKFSSVSHSPFTMLYIEFFMEKAIPGDKIFVISDTVSEEYSSQLLAHKRSITSAASPIEFTFSRFNLTADIDAKLNVTWKIVEECSCAAEFFQVKTDEPVVITSPNYPDLYCPNLVCTHTFVAPKGYTLEVRVDYADIEQYHDVLRIYDGNSTSNRQLARISGLRLNERYNTTTDTLYMVFMSDESVSNKGYHANIFARPVEKKKPASPSHWLVFIVTTGFVAVISAGALYFVAGKKMRRRREPPFQSLSNPTISYATSETGSSVSISFNGDGPQNVAETCAEIETI